ncbi:Disease resistance protein L6 [Linum perenne]
MTSTEHESSILPLPSGEYEVFLSFRGPDVRLNFADHLYTYLVSSKIRTFRDEEGLQRGEFIAPSLVKAITESKIYIPIFSKNYASSKWCLQELAKMVDCWKNGGEKGQHIILPVFYFIDPRDVRHPNFGSYKEAFEQHSLKHDPEIVLEWKNALQEVGKMKGWHITESDGQGAIIDKIFSKVDLHLRANYTLVTDELVGIDSQVEDVVKLLNLDSASEKIVGIHGMGGLGKTTLAKAVYNKVSIQFEGCCFLENIKDTLSKKDKDGVLVLQNKIISDTLRKHYYEANDVKDVNDGIRVRWYLIPSPVGQQYGAHENPSVRPCVDGDNLRVAPSGRHPNNLLTHDIFIVAPDIAFDGGMTPNHRSHNVATERLSARPVTGQSSGRKTDQHLDILQSDRRLTLNQVKCVPLRPPPLDKCRDELLTRCDTKNSDYLPKPAPSNERLVGWVPTAASPGCRFRSQPPSPPPPLPPMPSIDNLPPPPLPSFSPTPSRKRCGGWATANGSERNRLLSRASPLLLAGSGAAAGLSEMKEGANYASSKWCLQELAKMVDCYKNGGSGSSNGQQIILPVFYLMHPVDVRHRIWGLTRKHLIGTA